MVSPCHAASEMPSDWPNPMQEASGITDKTAGDGMIWVRSVVCHGHRKARKESGRERHTEKIIPVSDHPRALQPTEQIKKSATLWSLREEGWWQVADRHGEG